MAEGLSLESHAAKCAEIFGIPSRIVQRAQYVRYVSVLFASTLQAGAIYSTLLSSHEIGKLLDEDMLEKEKQELREAEEICRRFLAWDLSDGNEDTMTRLGEVLGTDTVMEE